MVVILFYFINQLDLIFIIKYLDFQLYELYQEEFIDINLIIYYISYSYQ